MVSRGARLGLLTSSNFFVPQVNMPGSMASFVKPAAISGLGALHRSSGLGTNWVIDGSGNTIDCDLWSNIFNTACWGFGTPVSGLPAGTTVAGAASVSASGSNINITPSSNWTSVFPWIAIGLAGVVALVVLRR